MGDREREGGRGHRKIGGDEGVGVGVLYQNRVVPIKGYTTTEFTKIDFLIK